MATDNRGSKRAIRYQKVYVIEVSGTVHSALPNPARTFTTLARQGIRLGGIVGAPEISTWRKRGYRP